MMTKEEVIRTIDHDYDCIKELEGLIQKQPDEETKIGLIELIAFIYSEYITGIYSSEHLEEMLAEYGKKIEFASITEPDENKVLMVMTSAAKVGGHTAAVNNWIRWDDSRKYSLVLTGQKRQDIPVFLKDSVSKSGGEILEVSGYSFAERAVNLLELSKSYGQIILFTHMYDVVPVIAYSNKNWTTPVYFCHHADFRFTLGLSVADRIMNLNDYDMARMSSIYGVDPELCSVVRLPGNSVVEQAQKAVTDDEEKASIRNKYGIPEDTKLIISMGADYKFQSIEGYEFDKFVVKLLEVCAEGTRFYIIGADSSSDKWKKMERITQGYAKALGEMPIENASEMISVADLFIGSFPMRASGMVLAIRYGLPALTLRVTDRNKDLYGNMVTDSMDELITRASSIINSGHDILEIEPGVLKPMKKSEWLSRWNSVLENRDKHSKHSITPFREVGRQEIINMQLLRENAGKNVARYLSGKSCDPDVLRVVYRMDENIAVNHYTIMNDRLKSTRMLSDKHLKLFKLAVGIMNAEQNGQTIADYVRSCGYKSIAIYGMHYLGEWLLRELRQNGFEVSYGIDRNAHNIETDIRLYKPDDKLPYVDVILNTTAFPNEMIIEEIEDFQAKDMVSINEIIALVE